MNQRIFSLCLGFCLLFSFVQAQAPYPDQQIYLIPRDTLPPDTLRTFCQDIQCYVFYRGDTLAEEWRYGGTESFLTPLKALAYRRVFLLQTHAGDGCPSLYKLLILHEETEGYTLTENFGNCNEIQRMEFDFPIIRFYFPALAEANRKKYSYTFDVEKMKAQKK
jgi:hypothetical protein